MTIKTHMHLSGPCSVFQSPSSSITVIQQRAPYAPGQFKSFAQNLSEWIKATGFKDVIVLSGLDAGKQLGAHSLPQQRVRFIAMSSSGSQQEAASSAGTSDLDAYEQRCRELSWPVLEDFTPTEAEAEAASANGGHHTSPSPEAPSGEGVSYGSMFGIDNGLERGQWWGPGKAYRKTAFWKMAEALKVGDFTPLPGCPDIK
jgi:hypothetical protein